MQDVTARLLWDMSDAMNAIRHSCGMDVDLSWLWSCGGKYLADGSQQDYGLQSKKSVVSQAAMTGE